VPLVDVNSTTPIQALKQLEKITDGDARYHGDSSVKKYMAHQVYEPDAGETLPAPVDLPAKEYTDGCKQDDHKKGDARKCRYHEGSSHHENKQYPIELEQLR
jgi:hypothetical protein